MTEETKTEEDRMAALRGYHLLDTDDEPEFEAIVREAAQALGTPIALVSLIDEHRQWFKARVGLGVQETPRSISFCTYAIQGRETMIVPDATKDDRFKDNPLVVGDPAIRFYAGAPLETADGQRIGTLCVIDRAPRQGLSDADRTILEDLAKKVFEAFEARKARLANADGDGPAPDS